MLVLILLSIQTSYKVGASAVPYGEDLMRALTAKQYVAQWIQDSFIFVSAVFFMAMATPALIYFKLLDKDKSMVDERLRTQRKPIWSLEYITPRLPAAMVYGIIVWLFAISSHGLILNDNDWVSTVSRALEVFLPVFIEVALAVLIGDILAKRNAFSSLVNANIRETIARIDKRIENYATDEEFLKMLYRNMREFFLQLERPVEATGIGRSRMWKPNATLENDPNLDTILFQEYERLMVGDNFVKMITTPTVPVLQATVAKPVEKRLPPNGDKQWTVETLTQDLRQRGLTSSYTEKDLALDYATGYNARGVWRAGAKNFTA